MFCKNCGKEISNTATFCPYCGTSTGAATASHGTSSVIFPNMGKWIKAFFSKKVVANLDEVAKDSSLAGLIGLLFETCVVALAIAILPAKTMGSISSLTGGMYFNGFTTFFIELFKQYFFIALVLGALLGVLYIVLAVNHKKVGIKQVLNLMFYALLPMTLAFGGCFIFSLLFAPLGILIFTILSFPAYLMTTILLYKGFIKLDTFETDPFYSFTLFSMVFALVVFIIFVIDIGTGIGSLVSEISGYMKHMDLSDIYKYFY